jgi:hypothetical protein
MPSLGTDKQQSAGTGPQLTIKSDNFIIFKSLLISRFQKLVLGSRLYEVKELKATQYISDINP